LARIAILQMTSGIDPAANLDRLMSAIKAAADGGAAMLFTPEMSSLIDRDRARAARSIVNEAEDPTLRALARAATEHRIWVALGSAAVVHESGSGKNANRSLLFDDQGQVCGRYDKIHLFDVDLPTGESWRESSAYEAGQGLSVVETPVGRMGLSICYDIRFPSLYQRLSEGGAEIMTIPAAFTVPTGAAHWHVLLRSRAIENACWIVAAAQTGLHEDGRKTYGHSLVVNPWGEVILDMGEGVGLAFAEIDLAQVSAARSRIPVIAHRRPLAEPVVRS
jgi:deaminated glutathione amidase